LQRKINAPALSKGRTDPSIVLRPQDAAMLADHMRRFIGDHRGTTALIFALSLVPIIFLSGMGLDFSSATQKRIQLNAAADSAALSMVTPTAMEETCATAQTAAQNIFIGQAALVSNLNYSAPTFSGCVDGSSTRTVTVSYTAYSVNAFPNVFALLTGRAATTWPIGGTSTATATTSPNINFFLLLDNSPSMDIAATTAGINTMVANTSEQGGCALACHETNPTASDVAGNPNGEDNYTLAQNLGVVTRIENMASATSSLMSTASQLMTANNSTCPNGPGCYQMAIFTFNVQGTTNSQCSSTAIQAIYAPSCAPSSDLSAAQTAASGIDVLEVCSNNYLTCSNGNNDTDTDFEAAMTAIDSIMPTPGTGASGSSPQEVLFLVTDGVDDEINSTSCSQALDGTRCQQPFNTAWCTTIKNQGIRIAVLYTEYLPLPTNAWYNDWVAPFQSQIGPNMQSCASPGLFFQVTTDGDITAAMQELFQQAVSTARLAQ
jgi:Flp pilus assembly protein TadG